MHLTWIDYGIIALYFAFVLGIGAFLKSQVKSSSDFLLSGRSIPLWITALAFISANLGAQEVIGMGASGAKYGIATSHFYWIGAIPAMIFVGVFMNRLSAKPMPSTKAKYSSMMSQSISVRFTLLGYIPSQKNKNLLWQATFKTGLWIRLRKAFPLAMYAVS